MLVILNLGFEFDLIAAQLLGCGPNHVGRILRTLAASKRSGHFLELGTGTGLSTAWILAGMDDKSTLIIVDNNPAITEIAQKNLEQDSRLTIKTMDGIEFLQEIQGEQFDYIFANT